MKINKLITVQDSDSLARYFSDIRKYESLTKEEEKELIIKVQNNNDPVALDKLIKANLKFVVTVAKKYQGQGTPLLDLISEGNSGLIEAAKKFDVKRDLKFFSYAVWWIRIKIFTSLFNDQRVIRLPDNRALLVTRIKQEIQTLEQKLCRYPSIDELVIFLEEEFSEQEIKKALIYGGRVPSLQDKIGTSEDEDVSLEDVTAGEHKTDSIATEHSVTEELDRFLFHLTQYEYDVLCLNMGLNKEPQRRSEDIAKLLKLKHKDVMKLKMKALKRLKRLKNINILKDYLK